MTKYYAVRFLGGNRTCTTGTPNKNTGRLNIACDIKVFSTLAERAAWIDNATYEPSGLGGGERIAATKRDCRNYCLGMSVEAFNDYLLSLEY